MHSKNNIDQLHHIQKVKAPEYLLDRIHARIEAKKNDVVKPSWVMSLAAAVALLAMFNIVQLRDQNQQASSDVATALNSSMNLMTSNQLYHE